MKSGVIQFPGSNCDRDLLGAFSQSGSNSSAQLIWHKETSLPDGLDVIGIPGGFSFGDYLRCGAIAARSPIMRAVIDFANKGGYVIGICNGFQVLTESGLLPGVLMQNAGLKFVCKDVDLITKNTSSVFTSSLSNHSKIRVPVAHHEGNYRADTDTIKQLWDEDRVAFTYAQNPNGATDDIAGILSSNQRVLGMMPHPERRVDPALGPTDGKPIFDALLNALISA